MTARLVGDWYAELASLRREWSALAVAAGHPFATWEWASTWWHHYGGGKRLEILAEREPDGRLVALVPLYVWKARPIRVLRFVGHGPADRLGPVAAADDRARAADALDHALASLRWDVFVGDQIVRREETAERLGGRRLAKAASPFLRFDGRGWDAFLAGRSANFRQTVRRRERRLAREHVLAFRLSDAERLDGDLDRLFELHEARWRGASSFARRDRAFQRDFARRALEQGWLRLWLLELDGTVAAAWYGLRFGGWEWYYQSGRDPAFDRLSVGSVLLAHSIRSAIEDGVDGYSFLRGDEEYKQRFADEDEPLESFAVAQTRAGAAAVAAVALSRRLARATAG